VSEGYTSLIPKSGCGRRSPRRSATRSRRSRGRRQNRPYRCYCSCASAPAVVDLGHRARACARDRSAGRLRRSAARRPPRRARGLYRDALRRGERDLPQGDPGPRPMGLLVSATTRINSATVGAYALHIIPRRHPSPEGDALDHHMLAILEEASTAPCCAATWPWTPNPPTAPPSRPPATGTPTPGCPSSWSPSTG
jgi:hypothetical protein